MENGKQTGMVFGLHPVEETIRAGKEIEKIFIQAGERSPRISEIANYARANGIPVQYVPLEKMNRLTRKNHQGVVAYVCPIAYQSVEQVVPMIYESGKVPFIIILDRVTDVRNFGAIARSAYAAGAQAVVVPSRGSALVNADAMKASAGALSLINVCRTDNLKKTIEYLKNCGISIFSVSEKGKTDIWNAGFTDPVAIIMGSEEDGVSEAYMKLSDDCLRIPMPGDIDSLNVSVATGVVCFEVVRQRANL